MLCGPGVEITSRLQSVCEDLEVDLDEFLPTGLIERIEADINTVWAGKYTLESLYRDSEKGAHRLVLNAFGHGVHPSDDPYEADLLKEAGVNPKARCAKYYENDYNATHELIEALIAKL